MDEQTATKFAIEGLWDGSDPRTRISRDRLPPIVVASPDIKDWIKENVLCKRLRKIGPGLYTSESGMSDEEVEARYFWTIISHCCPDSVITDASVLMGVSGDRRLITMAGPRERHLLVNRYSVTCRKGPGPVPGDRRFSGSVHMASPARAALDNMKATIRQKSGRGRTAGPAAIFPWLLSMFRSGGEEGVQTLMRHARMISAPLDRLRELAGLEALAEAVLVFSDASVTEPLPLPRRLRFAAPVAYDHMVVARYSELRFECLRNPPVFNPAPRFSSGSGIGFIYFQANFLVGADIPALAETCALPSASQEKLDPAAACAARAVSRILSTPAAAPASGGEFLVRLRRFHALASDRQRPLPFRTEENGSGHGPMSGSLARAYEQAMSLTCPVRRAAMTGLIILDLRPFATLNTAMAGLMIDAELRYSGDRQAILPTRLLREMIRCAETRDGREVNRAAAIIEFGQRLAASLPWQTVASAREALQACNAFDLSPHAPAILIP